MSAREKAAANQKISFNIWFDAQAEEAATYYVSVFNNTEIGQINKYPNVGQEIHGKPEGSVMTVNFRLEGQGFTALNGGPQFKPNPAISFFVSKDTKGQIDDLWEKLSYGGKVLMPLETYPFSEYYGWVQDKYGVSWQLILPGGQGDWRPTIVPSLLFVGDQCGKAEEAIEFYQSVFQNSASGITAWYDAGQGPDVEGTIMYADFAIENQWFAAMDSAQDHDFQFNEAISLVVNCDTQAEVDYYWKKLGEGGDEKAQACGWLKDRFGVSWQIVPRILPEMLKDHEQEKSQAVFKAMLQMKKFDIAALKKAYR